ncbi:short chain dehydrogenase [Ameyamaea chiangmaiensis NBRC 103196]|uniref:TetR/AcrR family transcriptional regulator n=1 Tax=Ameyamaea chiangmaiensis TaxID=442969 RepID=A0A850P886_9PROT|nr:TetR/AcrR family transcriptional regulator [Ameyamaea chiangmaiensis]MBS4075925.1 TetR/AcrR family transcriptional regulator [Ameyamaea chiangmaiensis]NVN40174.1 TetR/AcrR family transcriptional regulator [Ameyamaea chiangmaiensis]GBQ61716.1 short chain dehydrogenase [Ameyamaea chiangmaiensis NBRC 103196]
MQHKPPVSSISPGGLARRRRVIEAAEALLREGKADFSMRDLAARADVSFATPFNQFGSKAAIMHALSARRIDTMRARLLASCVPPEAEGRVMLALDLAVSVILEEPTVNRAVLGWLGTAGPVTGEVWTRSSALWAQALGEGEGLTIADDQGALSRLAGHLAFAFRGVLSFWTAGEIPDADLAGTACDVARGLLAGCVATRVCV